MHSVAKVLCAIGTIALCGCANMKETSAPANATALYAGKAFTVVTHKKPSFTAMTWGKIALGSLAGPVGGAAAGMASVSDGNNLIELYAVPDPAVVIAGKFGPDLAAKFSASAVTNLADQDSDDAKQLAKLAGGSGVVVDVQTVNWMFLYFPLDWTHYKVMYVGRARLIDAATSKEIALVPCQWDTSDEKKPPSYDELLADNAAALKAKLSTATDVCLAKYQQKLLAH